MADPPIDYAAPALTPVSDVRFRPVATLLLAATFVASAAAGVIGLIYADRLGGSAACLILTGVLSAAAILGFLARPQPAFGKAVVVVFLSACLSVWAFVQIRSGHDRLEAEILARAPAGPDDVVISVNSDDGAHLATWRIARIASTTSASLTAALTCYLIARKVRLARTIRRNNPTVT